MNIQTICLALLAHGEASGYDLKKRWTEGPFAHFVDASFGSIYPALARLEKDGLVTFRDEGQPGKPPRKVYSLTERGRSAFIEALAVPPPPDAYRSSFALIALCAPFLEKTVISQAVDTRLDQQRHQIEAMEALRPHCSHPSIDWLLEWGLSYFNSDLKHLEARRTDLENLAGTRKPGEEVTLQPCCSAPEAK